MDPEQKEQIAQERYGKSFEELSTNEQRGVGGVVGGQRGGTTNLTPEERAQRHGGSGGQETEQKEQKDESS